MKSLPHATAVLEAALAARACSAIAAEIGSASGATWTYASGQLGFTDATRANASTIFDLASLTKVLSTTAIAFLLVREGRLALDVPIAHVVPEWSRDDGASASIRDCLEHSTGLPAHRDYFRTLSGRDAYVKAIAVEPLEYPTRTQSLYSDLGFIVLGAALERLGAASLEQQFEAWKTLARLDAPLRYLPPSDWKPYTAMSDYNDWRGRWLHGEVHDDNAAALGGVAPHAGLFGTAAAVGSAARWWLRQFATSEGQQFARRSTVPGSSRALGWDTMLPTSSCGTRMSASAIGHTGFTGTSLWIDPARDRYFVLLTNRVHASSTSDAIQTLRRGFHDAAHTDLS
jgi:CubicO group peptidase (beta-lactamase class C family)